MIEILEHLEDYAKALKEAYRVLNSRGRIIIHTPNLLQEHILCVPKDNEEHVRVGFTRESLHSILTTIGFYVEYTDLTFNKFEALAWDLVYCNQNQLGFKPQDIVDLSSKRHIPYGILVKGLKP